MLVSVLVAVNGSIMAKTANETEKLPTQALPCKLLKHVRGLLYGLP